MLSISDIKRINKLHRKINRKKTGQFIVEGDKCVRELLSSSYKVLELYAIKDWKNTVDNTEVKYVSSLKLQRLSSLKNANKVYFWSVLTTDSFGNTSKGQVYSFKTK